MSRLDLVIKNPVFDGNFCPIHGNLQLYFNGLDIEINVDGTEIFATGKSFDDLIKLKCVAVEAGSCSWAFILETTLQQILCKVMTNAILVATYQKSIKGDYYVN